jgi:hypothetical protein
MFTLSSPVYTPKVFCFTTSSILFSRFAHSTAQTSTLFRKQLKSEDVSPHRFVPNYPFLSTAKYLIEANMKEAWGNLINIVQDMGGVIDEDEDGDYSDKDEGDDNDNDNDGDDVSLDFLL